MSTPQPSLCTPESCPDRWPTLPSAFPILSFSISNSHTAVPDFDDCTASDHFTPPSTISPWHSGWISHGRMIQQPYGRPARHARSLTTSPTRDAVRRRSESYAEGSECSSQFLANSAVPARFESKVPDSGTAVKGAAVIRLILLIQYGARTSNPSKTALQSQ